MNNNCDDQAPLGNSVLTHASRRGRGRRAFTMLELAVASALFLLAAAVLSLAVAESVVTTSQATARRMVESQLQAAATKIVNSPNAYDNLLANTFTPPSACAGQSGSGTNVQSCLLVNNTIYQATWSVSLGSDAAGTSTAAAGSLTLTGTANVATGVSVSVTRVVAAPGYAYATGSGVVRVQVSDPSNLMSGPVFLLSYANPSTVITSGVVSNGVALLRAPAASCTSTNPCVLGLSSGNNYASNGQASMIASQMTGTDAQIVLTAGQATFANLTVRGVGTATLQLVATNTATTQSATNGVAGSVCLYANFDDGTALQAAPVCNWQNPESISLSDYAPDPSRPNVRIPFPLNTPITFTTDLLGSNKNSTNCPSIVNPYSSGPSAMVGWTGSAWTASAVCTSWTWGTPTSLTVGASTSAWGAGGSLTLTSGSSVTGSVNWTGSGNAANLFVADANGQTARMVTPNGVATTFASGSFNSPQGITVDAQGDVFVANMGNSTISEISPTGGVSVIAGSGSAGYTNAVGTAAQFNAPRGLALSSDGSTLYVADSGNNVIRQINLSTKMVTTLATTGVTLNSPRGVAVNGSSIYIADTSNNRIVLDIGGSGSVLAGSGTSGSANGTGTSAQFSLPWGVGIDPSGTYLYVADTGNNLIRVVNTTTGAVSTWAGSGTAGNTNGTGTGASFNAPRSVTVGSSGTVYVAEYSDNLIRAISPSQVVTTLAGSGTASEADGTGTGASFNAPGAIASVGGWLSNQPAVGYGTVAVWSMARTAQSCSSSGTCTSIGAAVPENTACFGSACYAAAIPYLVAPQNGGQHSVVVSGSTGTTVTFNVTVADYTSTNVTVKVGSLPGSGTLKNGSGTALGAGATVTTFGSGGGTVSMEWTEGSSQIGQTSFTLTLSNSTNTVTYPIALYRTAAPWVVSGYGASVAQGASTSLNANITLANGSLATASSATFSCTSSCPTGLSFSPATVSSEAGGIASTTVNTTAATPAGTYSITVTSGAVSGTMKLVVTPVVRTVTISTSPTSVAENSTSTATITTKDGAGNVMNGVPVSVVATKSGSVALGVYASLGGCVTSGSGTCTVTITVERGAPAGSYVLTALAGSYSGTASLTVTAAPAAITVTNVAVNQGSTGSVSLSVVDGTGAALAGQVVSFSSTTAGLSIANSGATNSLGQATATATATSAVAPGVYNLTATSGTATAVVAVTVNGVVNSVNGSALTIARGSSGSEVITIKDVNGYGIGGALVNFSSSVSGITVVPKLTTGSTGTVSVTIYVSSNVSTGTYATAVVASSGTKNYAISVTVQ